MASNRTSMRKTRSERLFDELKETDSPLDDCKKYISNNERISSVSNLNGDSGFENSEGPKSSKKSVNEEKLKNYTNGDDGSKFKGLLQEIDEQFSVVDLCAGLNNEKSDFAAKCQSALGLAVLCRSHVNEQDCKCIFDALSIIPDHHEYALSFCRALLMNILTKQNLSLEHFSILEDCLLKVANSVIHREELFGNVFIEARIVLLGGERFLTAYKLCEEIFPEEKFDLNSLDVTTLCCSAFKNLSKSRIITMGQDRFTDGTLKYVISMIAKSSQEIILENLIPFHLRMENEEEIGIFPFIANQCLQILEQVLIADPLAPCKTLDYKEYTLMRCLTQLLDWCVSSIFPPNITDNQLFKVQNAIDKFHISTLLSLLKVLSVLSFDTNQYESYQNGEETIEKMLSCILKIYFQSEDDHFDILVLALEVLINFSLKFKKLFVKSCSKEIPISGSENMEAIAALLKILDCNIEKISQVQSRDTSINSNTDQNSPETNDNAPEEHDMDLVLKAADEDMELSTIVSFIGILVMMFMENKSSIGYVRERLSHQNCLEVVVISKKVLQLAVMSGGMPPTGVLLLKAAIKKFSQLY